MKVDELRLLTKSLRPLPEKFHGLTDQEIRYRQRYLDLIMNEASRNTFMIRSRIVQFIREFLNAAQFPGSGNTDDAGNSRRRHRAALYDAITMRWICNCICVLRRSLYLKRLVVGGFEKVYEINRNFRNEGLSTRHNPEFTMLEFYEAYADYHDLMDMTEEMLRAMAENVFGQSMLEYQGDEL